MKMKMFNGILVGNRFKDLTGQRFGKIVVLYLSHQSQKRWYWLCECDCGNKTTTLANNLKRGLTKSCGCLSFTPNKIIKVDEKTLGIVIHSSTHGKHTVLIDSDDYSKVASLQWCVRKRNGSKYKDKFYAQSSSHVPTISMHQFIFNSEKTIDHINGNSLDNRKENLRNITQQQNTFNSKKTLKHTSSIYKGVTWFKSRKKWLAKITFNSKCIFLGYFIREEDAARAYNEAAIKYFGKFACLNEIGST